MFGGIPQSEISLLDEYWQSFTTLKSALFDDTTAEYTHIKTDDIKKTIVEHENVKAFISAFNSSFGNFNDFLKKQLLDQMETLKIQKVQTVLSADIFKRLKDITLIDKYEAYQLLDNSWLDIAQDLEIIQTEGFKSIRQVDANMVLKKKNGKEQEVQDGWKGHILPFDLVQKTYLKKELESLREKENTLVDISATYEEILESLSEEEKEEETIKESKDAFVNAAVVKVAKLLRVEIKKNGDFKKDSYEAKILKVDKLLGEEKALKKEIKTESEALHILTKETIENLSQKEVYELLELKWIKPLITALHNLPNEILNTLTSTLQSMSKKYETTLSDIENEINETENELSSMVDELTGNEFDMKGLNAFKELLNGR